MTAQTHPATVLAVHDGDTIKVAIRLAKTRSLIRDQWAAAWNGNGTKPTPAWPRTETTT